MRKPNSDRQAPRPNIVSTNILFQGLARYCSNWANSRQKYAELATKLYQELINMDYVPYGNARIHTPLMTIYASTGNLNKVKSCFSSIRDKDVVALNGYLDACTQCGSIGEALNAFRKYVGFSADKQEHDKEKSDYDEKIAIAPDVITYTVLISSILRSIHAIADGISDSTEDSSSQAHNSAKMAQAVVIVTKRSILLYNDMTTRWNIVPDKGFVDSVLNIMCGNPFFNLRSTVTMSSLSDASDAERRRLVLQLLKQMLTDAKKHDCFEDNAEYEARLQKVEKCVQKEKLIRSNQMNQMFRDKGWNEVDSHFRLFGVPTQSSLSSDDAWLKSKGWNDVNSGFRII